MFLREKKHEHNIAVFVSEMHMLALSCLFFYLKSVPALIRYSTRVYVGAHLDMHFFIIY